MNDIGKLVSEQLLPRVRRPGQYVGLEINARWPGGFDAARAGDVAVVMAFPDAYSIGISHLGGQVLYHMLNDTPGVGADRTYCPMPDAEAVMREREIPLFGWESRCAVRDFDVVGFSLPYELCVTNVLTMLDLAGIPLHAAERTDRDPLIVGGDALADTPEPLAEFFDLLLVGDGEGPLAELVELVRQAKRQRLPRRDVILQAARTIRSAYAPSFYRPRYDRGAFTGLDRLRDDVSAGIVRARVASLSDSPAITRPLVPLAEAVHDRVTIEVMRGCPHACRFCQAGATRLPVRVRSVADIVQIARQAVAATGYREISLLGLSASDLPNLGGLIDRLTAEFAPQNVSISLPSLRVDSQLKYLPRLTSTVRKGGLTIAAEAGSQRLREAVRKEIVEADMIAGVRAAYEAGWRRVKVYFLAGLPGETPADIDAIFELCMRLSDTRREIDGQRGAIAASVSWFVPKPHTPMQWCAMRDGEYLLAVRRRLRELSRRSPVSFKFHRVERSLLESLLCRGDRRVGAVIEAAWRHGARLDSWDEHFDYAHWAAAMEQAGIGLESFVHEELSTDQPLPWDHIVSPRGKRFLLAEYGRMLSALGGPGDGEGPRPPSAT
ncbi:MAG TPA: TIGR03960 family B12-binding radical SAM protein [Phycisphaerae bacterium]|nr:TIGR03960 family B12-binding radical SAM protein [Phycisphaerae bacterium]